MLYHVLKKEEVWMMWSSFQVEKGTVKAAILKLLIQLKTVHGESYSFKYFNGEGKRIQRRVLFADFLSVCQDEIMIEKFVTPALALLRSFGLDEAGIEVYVNKMFDLIVRNDYWYNFPYSTTHEHKLTSLLSQIGSLVEMKSLDEIHNFWVNGNKSNGGFDDLVSAYQRGRCQEVGADQTYLRQYIIPFLHIVLKTCAKVDPKTQLQLYLFYIFVKQSFMVSEIAGDDWKITWKDRMVSDARDVLLSNSCLHCMQLADPSVKTLDRRWSLIFDPRVTNLAPRVFFSGRKRISVPKRPEIIGPRILAYSHVHKGYLNLKPENIRKSLVHSFSLRDGSWGLQLAEFGFPTEVVNLLRNNEFDVVIHGYNNDDEEQCPEHAHLVLIPRAASRSVGPMHIASKRTTVNLLISQAEEEIMCDFVEHVHRCYVATKFGLSRSSHYLGIDFSDVRISSDRYEVRLVFAAFACLMNLPILPPPIVNLLMIRDRLPRGYLQMKEFTIGNMFGIAQAILAMTDLGHHLYKLAGEGSDFSNFCVPITCNLNSTLSKDSISAKHALVYNGAEDHSTLFTPRGKFAGLSYATDVSALTKWKDSLGTQLWYWTILDSFKAFCANGSNKCSSLFFRPRHPHQIGNRSGKDGRQFKPVSGSHRPKRYGKKRFNNGVSSLYELDKRF